MKINIETTIPNLTLLKDCTEIEKTELMWDVYWSMNSKTRDDFVNAFLKRCCVITQLTNALNNKLYENN